MKKIFVSLLSTTLLGGGQAFADVSQPVDPNPATANTPINATLTLNENPTAPEPPTGPDEGGTDAGTGITGLFGIAYAPQVLSGSAELQEKGQTEVTLTNNSSTNTNNKYNVGVQDKTRAKDRNWTLSARLEWTNDTNGYMEGTTITAIEGNAKLNDGKGVLTPIAEGEVTTDATSLTIQKDVPTTILAAQKGKTVNGVYNYQFKDPKLVIPTSERVAEGTYTGNIVWDLSSVVE